MSARLAIGAVGALAGLAALGSRRGSRQRRVGWSIDHVADLSAYASWRQIVDEGVVLVAGYASYAGGIREFEIAADDWGLEQFREFASTWIWDEIHAGGTEASYLARLQGQLEDFRAWLEALRYPLTVYRGIRLGAHDDLQLGVDDDAEVYHDHWSTSLPVARGFASGAHRDASSGRVGVVLSGVVELPDVGDIGHTLGDFLRFTAGFDAPGPDDQVAVRGQWEIGPVNEKTIKVQERM
jgi:hypothetical protein